VKPADCPRIEFVSVSLVQFTQRESQPYFTLEEFIAAGKWEKYNGNSGLCAPFPTPLGTMHQAVQAFSHWTHHVSEGRLLVVDCQGCYNQKKNEFILTDPAVHCTSLLCFGGTNWGSTGFKRFYKTHVCNRHCAALGLPVQVPAAADKADVEVNIAAAAASVMDY
jgi:hypothetical protein